MKYEELSDKEKVRLILQHVIPHEIADDIVFNGRHIVIERRWTKDNPVKPIDWPVAAWDDAAEVWWTRDIASNWDTAFNPLHDLNDTWLVVERMTEEASVTVKTMYRGEDKYIQCHIDFYADDQPPFHVAALTAPQAICLATLYAKGIIDYEGNVIEANE